MQAQPVATKVLDMGVNMGVGSAARLLQEAANQCGAPPPPLAVDGKIGPLTLAAVNASDGGRLLEALRAVSASHYRAIAASDPAKYERYLHGWLHRADA